MSRFTKILTRTVLLLLTLVVLLLFLLFLPPVQNFLTQRLENYLENKLATKVEIGQIALRPLKSLVISEVYIEDLEQDTLLNLQELTVDFSLAEIWNRKIAFNHIGLKGLKGQVLMDSIDTNYGFILDAFTTTDTSIVVKDENQQVSDKSWELVFHHSNVDLENIDVLYDDEATKTIYDIKLKRLQGITNNINLAKNEYDVQQVLLKNADIKIVIPENKDTTTATLVAYDYDVWANDLKIENLNLELAVAGLEIKSHRSYLDLTGGEFAINDSLLLVNFPTFDLKSDSLTYHVLTAPTLPKGFDYNHLDLDSVHLNVDSFLFNNYDISANIQQFQLKDQQGFKIKEFQTRFDFTPNSLDVKNLHLLTGRSSIEEDKIDIFYPFFDKQPLAEMQLALNTVRAKIALTDLLYFQPYLDTIDFFNQNKNQSISIRTTANGTLKDLKIPDLDIGLWNNTRAQMAGRIYNVLDINKIRGLLKINVLETTDKGLKTFLPKGTIPDYVELPNRITAKGLLKGSLAKADLELEVITSRSTEPLTARLQAFMTGQNILPIEKAKFNIQIDTFLATRNELTAYLPPETLPEYMSLPDLVLVTGNINGNLDAVNTNLKLSAQRGNSENHIAIQGDIADFTEPQKMRFDLTIPSLNLNERELLAYLPDSTLPAYIVLPFIHSGKGAIKGTLDNLLGGINLDTNNGDWTIAATLKEEDYNLRFNISDFVVERLFSPNAYDTIVGMDLPPWAVDLTMKGNGLDLQKNLKTGVYLQLYPETEEQYRKGLIVDGVIDRLSFLGDIKIEEKELNFLANAFLDFNASQPLIETDLKINHLNLQALQLTEVSSEWSGTIAANVKGLSLDSLNAEIKIDDLTITYDTLRNAIDSLILTADLDKGNNEIYLESDVAMGHLMGQFEFSQVSEHLQQLISNYFSLEKVDALAQYNDNCNFYIEFLRPEILTMGFIPGLTELSPFFFNGSYSSKDYVLKMYGEVPWFTYAGVEVDSISSLVRTNKEGFRYDFDVKKINVYDQLNIFRMEAIGTLDDNRLASTFKFLDEQGKERFNLKSFLATEFKSYRLQLAPEQLINYKTWRIPAQNALLVQKDKINVLGWKLSYEDAFIQLVSTSFTGLDAYFSNFDLGQVADIIQYESRLFGGELNGKVKFENLFQKFTFDTDLTIDNFSVTEASLGQLNIKANNKKEDNYNVNAILKGNGNDVFLKGDYRVNDEFYPLDFNLDIQALNLPTVEPFADVYLSEMKGILKGKIHVTGTPAYPELIGKTHFEKASFRVNLMNSKLYLGEENIEFDANAIFFDTLTVRDSLNNLAQVGAYVTTLDYRDYELDLTVNAKNFLVLSTTEKDNDLYYGSMIVDATAKITGDLFLPLIEADVVPRKGSKVTYIMPFEGRQIETGEGIVEFVDFDEPEDIGNGRPKDENVVYAASGGYGFKLIATIHVNDSLDFKAILDSTTGDNFEGKAEGDLTYTLFPNGAMELIGRADLVSGTYLFTYYDIIQRTFDIAKGSNITWIGDPFNPDLDIDVHYKVRTSPYALVPSDESLRNVKHDYTVELQIGGTLEKTEIKTNILYPSGINSEVAATIEGLKIDESRMNTQAFGLILFNGFVAQDLGNTDFTKIVDVSSGVNNLITQQLNQLANRYIKFVELDFGFDSYATEEGSAAADFRVSLKKRFLNDRLVISVDGVASTETNSDGTNKSYLDNLTVEYLLTKDGVFKINLYNTREEDDFIGENSVKLGGALVIAKEFKEIKLKRGN